MLFGVQNIEKKLLKSKNYFYSLAISFQRYCEFIVSNQLALLNLLLVAVREDNITELVSKLPMGYRVFENSNGGWDKLDKQQYYFVFMVMTFNYYSI